MEQRKREKQKTIAIFSHCFKIDYFMAIIGSILIFGTVKAFSISNDSNTLLQCAVGYTACMLLEMKTIINRNEEKLVISDTHVKYFSGGWKLLRYTITIPICAIDSCEISKNLLQIALGTSTLKIYVGRNKLIEFGYIQDGEKAESIINDMLK